MSGILNVLIVIFLLLGVQCDEFSVSLPKRIEVLSGSCVTIPCSFQVEDEYKQSLHSGCRGLWIDRHPNPKTKFPVETGKLTRKNCTTTLYNVNYGHHGTVLFRLDCNNSLVWTFKTHSVNIIVKEIPPTPTLTPPTLNVSEGQVVTVHCSTPVPCLSAPLTLTWTPDLGDIEETLQVQQDKTYVKVSTLTFTASYIHHERTITCTAAYSREQGTPVSAVNTPVSCSTAQLMAHVTFSPQILNSSNCTGDSAQISCLCQTEGNPFPMIHWELQGISANVSIISETLSDKALRSTILITQPQWRDPFTLGCHSSNSLGSDSHRFNLPAFKPQGAGGELTSPVFISTVVILLALVCVLLLVIRILYGRLNTSLSTAKVMKQLLESNEPLTETQRNIHDTEVRQEEQPTSSNTNNVQESSIYSTVNWKTKTKKRVQGAGDAESEHSSYLEEHWSIVGNGSRHVFSDNLVDSEYAQIKFKPMKAMPMGV